MDPPPPYSPTLEAHSTPRQTHSLVARWHPKITPFRLFVLLSTIILGTSKAVFAYRGGSSISTTLEWITGVIFTLFIFILGEWESKENYPKHLRWLFVPDCMGLIWMTTRILSLPRPVYRSDESNAVVISASSASVSVTGYRILVSTVVVALGSAKATLAYLGYNTTANTVDWTLGVWVTSILYYVGLYESNSVGLAPNFFSRNYASPILRIVRDVVIAIALAYSMYICIKWVRFCLGSVKNASGAFATSTPSSRSSFIILQSFNVLVLVATIPSLILSLSCTVAILTLTALAFRQEYSLIMGSVPRQSVFAEFNSRVARWVSDVDVVLQFRRARRIGIFFLRISAHLLGMVVIVSLILLFFGLLMILREEYDDIGKRFSKELMGNLVAQLVSGVYVVSYLWLLYRTFLSLIAPFRISTGGLGLSF